MQEGCGRFSAIAGIGGEADDEMALETNDEVALKDEVALEADDEVAVEADDEPALVDEEMGDMAANQKIGEEGSPSQRSNFSNCCNLIRFTWETQKSSSNMISSSIQGSSNDVPDSLQSTEAQKMPRQLMSNTENIAGVEIEVQKLSGHLKSNAGKSAGEDSIESYSGNFNPMGAIKVGHVVGPETKKGKEADEVVE
ncbi:hypothetical protein SLA2020_097100 [Shorea laevis]